MKLRPLGLCRPFSLASATVDASNRSRSISLSPLSSSSSSSSPLSSRHNLLRYVIRTVPQSRSIAGSRRLNARECDNLECGNLRSSRSSEKSSRFTGSAASARLHQLSTVQWSMRHLGPGNGAVTKGALQSRSLFSKSVRNQQSAVISAKELSRGARQGSEFSQVKRNASKVPARDPNTELRPDASSRLSTMSTRLPKDSLKRKLAAYLALTKPHLSFLVVLTATTAYGLYPTPTVLELDSSLTQLPTLSTSTLTFFYLGVGTFLTSASAATLNMLFEPEHDSKMSRTRNRPLVRGLMSKRAASIFAIITGIAGVTALYNGTNPSVAGLGAFNLVLYSFIYTPLKKISVLNTWVGAVVGGIPPLMGWVAAAGQIATTGHDGWRDLVFGPDSPGGWLLAAILYAWQFPHFNALSWSIREEYKRAGSRMLAWTNPAMNGRVALRYSILMFPLCAGLWYVGVVNKGFLVIGTAINAWMAKEAYLFWKLQGAKASARGLFWASIWHLPILMVGCLATKTGVWEGIWARAMSLAGYDDGDDDEDEYIEEFIDEEEAVKLAAVQLAAHAR